jgi:hypothetical protein
MFAEATVALQLGIVDPEECVPSIPLLHNAAVCELSNPITAVRFFPTV